MNTLVQRFCNNSLISDNKCRDQLSYCIVHSRLNPDRRWRVWIPQAGYNCHWRRQEVEGHGLTTEIRATNVYSITTHPISCESCVLTDIEAYLTEVGIVLWCLSTIQNVFGLKTFVEGVLFISMEEVAQMYIQVNLNYEYFKYLSWIQMLIPYTHASLVCYYHRTMILERKIHDNMWTWTNICVSVLKVIRVFLRFTFMQCHCSV